MISHDDENRLMITHNHKASNADQASDDQSQASDAKSAITRPDRDVPRDVTTKITSHDDDSQAHAHEVDHAQPR